jgi:geranylgeranyl reductase family protein
MNECAENLPERCDVLVVGAGPAGSAAAITLASAGLSVVMLDQHAFPRDKVCGDGLIPDAHRALARLGVLDQVMQQAQSARAVRCTSPKGRQIDVEGTLAVLPRKQLDDIVCRAAVSAGARMFAPLQFSELIEEDGRVVGARVQQGQARREIRSDWVVLATGAVPTALLASQMLTRQAPSAIAMRCYVRNDVMAHEITELEVIFHRQLAPGYGWIFPCGQGVFNVGVGVFNVGEGLLGHRASARSKVAQTNLRAMFDQLSAVSPSVQRLIQSGERLGPLKGAPLRCTLEGARLSRPGLLVCGEAAGSTYALTGEGIGKALETGILAGEAIKEKRPASSGPDEDHSDEAVQLHYEAQVQALRPQFKLYERAQIFSLHPWLADVVMGRVQKSPRLRSKLSGVLNETSNPGRLFTWRGLMRLLTG